MCKTFVSFRVKMLFLCSDSNEGKLCFADTIFQSNVFICCTSGPQSVLFTSKSCFSLQTLSGKPYRTFCAIRLFEIPVFNLQCSDFKKYLTICNKVT